MARGEHHGCFDQPLTEGGDTGVTNRGKGDHSPKDVSNKDRLGKAASCCGKASSLLAMLRVLLVTNIQIRWIRPGAGTGEGCQGDSRKGKPVLQAEK